MLSLLLNFIPGVGPFLSLAAKNWKLVLALLVSVAIGLFVYDWHRRGLKLVTLEAANASLTADLKVAAEQRRLAEAAEKVAASRLERARSDAATLNSLAQEAYHAPTSQDAPIAPVLGNTLSRLRSLRAVTSHSKANHSPRP